MNELINEQRDQIAQLTAERDALAAKLQAVSDEIMAIINDSHGVSGYHLNGKVATWDSFDIVDLVIKTPQHHLHQVRADAGRDGFVAGYSKGWNDFGGAGTFRRETLANQYADKIRQEVE